MTKTFLLGGAAALPMALAALAPTLAQDGPVSVEANVALVSDYRFRGVSFTDRNIAIQGGFDASHESGLYVGTWASNLDSAGGIGGIELDVYGGYGFEAGGFSFDVGGIGYLYPESDVDAAYGEIYGSVGTTVGIAEVGVGVAYAWEQDNVGDDDNTYIYVTGGVPLGETGVSLNGSVGYETGGFGDPDGDGDDKIDWLLGLSTEAFGLEFGVAYVDTSEDGDGLDAGAIFSVSKAF